MKELVFAQWVVDSSQTRLDVGLIPSALVYPIPAMSEEKQKEN